MRDQDKILGVNLDSIMTLDVLIASIHAAYQIIMHTRRINSNSIRQYITDGAVQTLTQSLVTLYLDYCNITYKGLPMKHTCLTLDTVCHCLCTPELITL